MNWKLVLLLCPLGLLMGALMVTGALPEGADRLVWFAVVVVCALVVARWEARRALLHGAVVGFVNGASSTLVQAFFVESLATNNPYVARKFANQPPGFDLEFFVFMLVPFIGVAGGAMTGLLATLAARVFTARRNTPDHGETGP